MWSKEKQIWANQHEFTVTLGKDTHIISIEDDTIYKQSTIDGEEGENWRVADQRLPQGRRFNGGLDVSYFVSAGVLFMRYDHIYNKNCHVIWLYEDSRSELLEENVYRTLASHHDGHLNEHEKCDVTMTNLNKWKVHLTSENEKLKKEKDETIALLQKQLAEQKQVVKEKQEYIDALPRNELKSVRDSINKDFEIQCKDCVSIPVHSGVLAAFWPWFKTMLENDCVETEKKSLKLDYDSEVVEVLIQDLYGQDFDLDFETCLPLLEITGMYQLPELAAAVYEEILLCEPDLDLENCVNGWKSARLGDHEQAKTFFAKLVYSKTKEKLTEEEKRDEFDVLTKEETLELLFGALM